MLSPEEMKRAAGEYAVQLIQPGFITGIGTGSTVYYFIHALAKKDTTNPFGPYFQLIHCGRPKRIAGA